ncbi:MAG: VWA domain-containing protein [Bacteroidales bacterium]|nr:VWA domain-containing protein [Bacteroidales bacterium]
MTKKLSFYWLSVVLLTGVLAMPFSSAKAQSAIERLKVDYPAVMEHYAKRLEAQKADYIIAIDVSGSMNKYKDVVVPALNSFLASLPEDDYVSIIKFGTKAEEFGLSGKINKSTMGAFQNTLSKVYDRDPAFVSRTDLAAMCEAVLAQMSRPGGNDLKYVFMFTDFVNEPGSASLSWDELASRVSAIAKNNMVRAFAMQLPGSNSGRDIQLVRNVFQGLQTISIDNSAQLNEWFEGQKAEISKVRLKDLIKGDFDQWYSEGNITMDLKIAMTSKLKLKYDVDGKVPAFVNGFIVNACEPLSQSSNVEKVNLTLDSAYKGRGMSVNAGSLKFYNNAITQKGVSTTVTMIYRPMFTMADKDGDESFSNDIRKLGLEEDLTRTVELTAEKGLVIAWNLWAAAGVLALIVLAIYLLFAYVFIPYRIKDIRVTATGIGGKKETYDFKKENSHLFGKKGTKLEQADFVAKIKGGMFHSIKFIVEEKPQTSGLTMQKDNSGVPSMKCRIKVGETIKLNQGLISFEFKINNVK